MEYRGGIYEISCGEPEIPTHGWIDSGSYTYPNTVTFHCEQGFRLKGEHIIRCESNGMWSGPSPRCFSTQSQFPWWILLLCLVLFVPVTAYIITKCYIKMCRDEDSFVEEMADQMELEGNKSKQETYSMDITYKDYGTGIDSVTKDI